MKIERANRRTNKPETQEYRFKEAQLIVRDNPSLPVEIEALAGVQFSSSQVVARALRNLIHMDQETFIALHLNGRLKISALKLSRRDGSGRIIMRFNLGEPDLLREVASGFEQLLGRTEVRGTYCGDLFACQSGSRCWSVGECRRRRRMESIPVIGPEHK